MTAADSEGRNVCYLDRLVNQAVTYVAGDPDDCYELNRDIMERMQKIEKKGGTYDLTSYYGATAFQEALAADPRS